MSQITITQPQLEVAMRGWVQDARAGRTRTHEETDAMPEALAAAEQAQALWERLTAGKRPSIALPSQAGEPFEGGFYVGRLLVASKLCAIIVSPAAVGDLRGAIGLYGQDVPAAYNYSDGWTNTMALAEAGSPLAQQMLQLEINGHKDWYLPARDELELLYRYLKPTTEKSGRWGGDNPSAPAPTYPYDPATHLQTPATAFQAGGEQALQDAWYWSSTQYSAHLAWYQWFDDGYQGSHGEGYVGRARAVRRLVIE